MESFDTIMSALRRWDSYKKIKDIKEFESSCNEKPTIKDDFGLCIEPEGK